MKRNLIASAFAVALTISLAACSATDAGKPDANTSAPADGACKTVDNLTIIGIGMYADAVPLLAEQTGIFERNCLSITQNTVANPPASIAALSGGSADIVYIPSVPFVNAVSKGLDIVVVGPSDGQSPDAKTLPPEQVDQTGVYVRPDSGITKPRDLEGKKVSVPARNAQIEITIAGAILKDGGDPSKVEWVQLDFPTAVDQLKNGGLDAAGLVSPFTESATQSGAVRIMSPAVEFFAPGTTVGIWTAMRANFEKKRDAMERFRSSMIEANAYAMANIDTFIEAVAEQTKVPVAEIKAASSAFYFGSDVTLDDLKGPAQLMIDLGYLDKMPDLAATFPK